MAVRWQAKQTFGTRIGRRDYVYRKGEVYDNIPHDILRDFAGNFTKFTTDDDVVEQATAAPGEKRTVKKSTK